MKPKFPFTMKLLLLLTTLLLNGLLAFAEIVELKSYSQSHLNADKNTWVIFDIDNTLLKPTTMIGSHQWGDYLNEQAKHLGRSTDEARLLQNKAFGSVQMDVPISPVERIEYEVIKTYKQEALSVFALTARPSYIKDATLIQLSKLKLSFEESTPIVSEGSNYFNNGVLFSGDKPKGELLKEVISQAQVKPMRIIFFDDRLYNLKSVEDALLNTGIEFVGYRYGATDIDLQNFRADIANIQWLIFQREKTILSNEMALEKLLQFKLN